MGTQSTMRIARLGAIGVFCTVGLLTEVVAAGFVFESGLTEFHTRAESGNLNDFRIDSLGSSFVRTTAAGTAASTTTYDFFNSTILTSLAFAFDHSYGPSNQQGAFPGSRGQAFSDFRFTVDGPYFYSFSGEYAFESGFNEALFSVRLSDSIGDTIFSSSQFSTGGDGGTFVVGGLDGDFQNVLIGSPTGTLAAGTYNISIRAFIEDGTGRLSSAALGNLDLEFALIPLPAPILMGGLGLLMVGIARKRLRRLAA